MTTTGTAVSIARQAVVDARLNLVGWELLYRDGPCEYADIREDSDTATYALTVQALVDFGLGRLVGDHLAYVHCPVGFLLDEGWRLLPSKSAVLEVARTVRDGVDLERAALRAVGSGYRLALDHYTGPSPLDALGSLVSLVKVDVHHAGPADLPGIIDHVRSTLPGAMLLAEKVETTAELERCRELGFSLFQGFVVGRPEYVHGTALPSAGVQTLQLVAELGRPDLDLVDIVDLIQHDAALSYRMLRLVNSASSGLVRPVTSLRQVLVLLGIRRIRHVAAVVALTTVSVAPPHLVEQLAIRAMMCQAVAEATGEVDPAAAFTVGLFSGLEDLLGVPMDHAVAGLHLDGALHDALATRTGPLGELLATAVDYQLGAVGPGSPGQSPVWLQAFADALNWVAPLRPMLYHPE